MTVLEQKVAALLNLSRASHSSWLKLAIWNGRSDYWGMLVQAQEYQEQYDGHQSLRRTRCFCGINHWNSRYSIEQRESIHALWCTVRSLGIREVGLPDVKSCRLVKLFSETNFKIKVLPRWLIPDTNSSWRSLRGSRLRSLFVGYLFKGSDSSEEIVHPKTTIFAIAGPIVIGMGCLIEKVQSLSTGTCLTSTSSDIDSS